MKKCRPSPFNSKSLMTRFNERINSLNKRVDILESTTGEQYSVKYIPQNLNEQEKKIARENLDIEIDFSNNEILNTYLNNST